MSTIMARLPRGIDGRASGGGGTADTGPAGDTERGGGGGAVGDGADVPSSSHDANATAAAPPAPPSSRAGVETIDDEDPEPVAVMAAMLETTKGAAGEERRPAGVEQIEEEEGDAGAPPPGSFADGAPKKIRNNHEETVVRPVECDGDLRGRDVGAAAEGEEGENSSVDTAELDAPEDAEDPEQANAPNASVYAAAENGSPGDSVPGITEAYAVDDTVVIAEPQLPLWKQTKVRLALAFFFVAVAVLAIALGVILSRENRGGESESTLAPTISTHPTVSPVPSSSPTECSYTVGSNRQKVNLLNPEAGIVRTALDGPNLVVAYIVASRYDEFGDVDEGSFYIEFFKLQNSGTWERVYYSIERNVDWVGRSSFDIALSGKTTVIGMPSQDDMAGAVHIFQESVIGTWESVASPEPNARIGECRFGESVDIDGDLVIVADEDYCLRDAADSVGPNAVYVFQQAGDEWEQVAVIESNDWPGYGQCVAQGDIVACERGDIQSENQFGDIQSENQFVEVHTIDPQNKSAIHIQSLAPSHDDIRALAISGNHLVSLAGPKGEWLYDVSENSAIWSEPAVSVFIYQRERAGKPYTFLQTLNSSDYGEGFAQAFALDGDMLVLGSSNQTHILSLQPSGRWKETLTLDQSYNHFQLSGRSLIATYENEVYSMDIADCTQPVPTQTPSISVAPTASCHWVNVQIVAWSSSFWQESEEWGYIGSWEAAIQPRDLLESDAYNIIVLYEQLVEVWTTEGVLKYENSTCLPPGMYQFTFHTELPLYVAPFTDKYYRVESNGQLIAQEKVSFVDRTGTEIDNIHPFDIPFEGRIDHAPTGPPFLTSQATRPPTNLPFSVQACLSRSECEEQMQSGEFVGFYTGTYADYGCFSKGDNLYWGTGGTEEQMAASPLAGTKERVWCGQ